MKIISTTNWLLIGVYTITILYTLLTVKEATDPAGRGLATVYLLAGAVLLLAALVLNLFPYRLTRIAVLVFLTLPALAGTYQSLAQLIYQWQDQKSSESRFDGTYYFSDPPRQQMVTAIAANDAVHLQALLQQPVSQLNGSGADHLTLLDIAAIYTLHSDNPAKTMQCVHLLMNKGATIMTGDSARMPTHLLVGRESSNELLTFFLQKGADPNALHHQNQYVPILFMVMDYPEDQLAKVNSLLDYGANPNSQYPADSQDWLAGHSALLAAARKERWAICQLLLERGADPTVEGPQHLNFPTLLAQTANRYELEGVTPPDFVALQKMMISRGLLHLRDQ